MAALIQEEEFAEESEKTKKLREKLKRQFSLLDQQITEEALKQTRDKIYDFIARKGTDRILLKEKNISLFDENQHAAKISKKVSALMQELKKTS